MPELTAPEADSHTPCIDRSPRTHHYQLQLAPPYLPSDKNTDPSAQSSIHPIEPELPEISAGQSMLASRISDVSRYLARQGVRLAHEMDKPTSYEVSRRFCRVVVD